MIKRIIITGAASGIGQATVESYLQQPHHQVIGIDINGDGLTALKASLSLEQQSRFQEIAIDLCDFDLVRSRLLSEVTFNEGIDHVIICHAIGFDNQVSEDAKWQQIVDVNFISVQRLFSLLEPYLREEGRIVVLSSILGKLGRRSNTGYVSTKHALLGLTKALALDLADRKITVNAVLPAWVDTPMLRNELKPQAAAAGTSIKQVLRQIKKKIPLRELISPQDVADTVMFLTSPRAKKITAQSIVIDGGFGCGA